MKTVKTSTPAKRIVTEQVRIDACGDGEQLNVPFKSKGCFNTVGSIVVHRIKAIGGGRVQIKYHKRYSSTRKVMKIDVPADLMVERNREAVEADGPDAGIPEVRTATHEGVSYRAIDPDADVDELLLAAVQAGMREGRTLASMIGLGETFAERASAYSLTGGSLDDVSSQQRANARRVVREVVAIAGAPKDGGPGLGKSLAIQHIAGLAAAGLTAAAHDGPEERDPDMRRMDDWLGAFEDRGILRPGAKEKLMGSIWTEDELRDGRPNPGSVVIDG